jgi:hypothetical protein
VRKKVLQGLRRVRSWPSCGKADEFLGKGTREGALVCHLNRPKEILPLVESVAADRAEKDFSELRKDVRLEITRAMDVAPKISVKKGGYTAASDRRENIFLDLATSRKSRRILREREYVYRRLQESKDEKSRLSRVLTSLPSDRQQARAGIRSRISTIDKLLTTLHQVAWRISLHVVRFRNEQPPNLEGFTLVSVDDLTRFLHFRVPPTGPLYLPTRVLNRTKPKPASRSQLTQGSTTKPLPTKCRRSPVCLKGFRHQGTCAPSLRHPDRRP